MSILRSEIDVGISCNNTLDKTRSHQTCLKSSIGRDSAGVPVRSMEYFAFCKSQNTIQGVRENQCLYKKSLNLQGSHPLPPTTLSPPEDSLGFRVSQQGRRPLPEEGAHMHWCVLLTHFSNSVIHQQLLSVTTQHCMSIIRCNQYLSFASYVPMARPLTKLKKQHPTAVKVKSRNFSAARDEVLQRRKDITKNLVDNLEQTQFPTLLTVKEQVCCSVDDLP